MPLNRQLILDDVFAAIIKQGEQAVNPAGACLLRVPGTNLKCAIGHLIPDDQYHVGLEALAPDQITDHFDPKYGIDDGDESEFLWQLQMAHDDSSVNDFVNDFSWCLRDVAHDYDLTTPVQPRG